MKLEAFIQKALVQIAKGVYGANLELTGTESPTGTVPFLMQRGNAAGETTGVAFDVAVVSESTTQGDVAGRFNIHVVDANIEGKVGRQNREISRIKFTVGVDQRLGYALDSFRQQE